MSTTETKVRKIALSRTRYELFEVTHDDSLGREVLSRPLNIDEMQRVVTVYNSHADMLEALEAALALIDEHADELAGFEHPDRINAVCDAAAASLGKAKGVA